jgi:hypothetical protein
MRHSQPLIAWSLGHTIKALIVAEVKLEAQCCNQVITNDEFECRWLLPMTHLKLFGKFSDNYSGSKPAASVVQKPRSLYHEPKVGNCATRAIVHRKPHFFRSNPIRMFQMHSLIHRGLRFK